MKAFLTSWGIVPAAICLGLIASLAYVGDLDAKNHRLLVEQAEIIRQQAERIEELSTITMGNITITIRAPEETSPKSW